MCCGECMQMANTPSMREIKITLAVGVVKFYHVLLTLFLLDHNNEFNKKENI